MRGISICNIKTRNGRQCRTPHILVALAVCSALLITGCTHVPSQQQRLVSKPNMQFYRSAMFATQNRMLSQVESSLASSAGGPASGGSCSSCSPGD